MTDDLSTKTVLFYDYGMFLPFAERLARDFGRVMYHTPWRSAFPHTADAAAGDGVPGIERVDNFFDALEHADLVVFPDCYDGDLVADLRRQGVRVWGGARAQWLELDRGLAHQRLTAAGVAMPPQEEIVGVPTLRDWSARTEDKWVKRSLFRGDFETFHHQKDFITQAWLDVIQKAYGPLADQVTFTVEDPVEGVELGWDAHSVDGKYPSLGMLGLELKDRALLGKLVKFEDLPANFRRPYELVAPFLAEGGCRSYVTLEVRIKDKESPGVLLDPCIRMGSPANEGWIEMVGNLSEVVWRGAAGELVEVQPAYRYCVLVGIESPWAVQNWTAVAFPEEIARWVKVKNRTVVDGRTYFIPGHHEMQEIGVLVGAGQSLDEAIGAAEDMAPRIEGYKVRVQTDSLREGLESIKEAAEVGFDLS